MLDGISLINKSCKTMSGCVIVIVASALFQLIHYTVIDTSVVFPHRLGLPHKRALRSLTVEYLRRIHQDDGKSADPY